MGITSTYEGGIDNPLALNKYIYGNSNPIMGIDPTGLNMWSIADVSAAHAIANDIMKQELLFGARFVDDAIFDGAGQKAIRPFLAAMELIQALNSFNALGAYGAVGDLHSSMIDWNNGWRTPDGKFGSPQGGGKSGEAAVDATEDAIKNRQKPKTWDVVGREMEFMDTDTGQIRRYDLLLKSPEGHYVGVEVKSGSATRNADQREFDKLVNKESGRSRIKGRGKAAGIEIRRSLLIRRK